MADKGLGQHFLLSQAVVSKIVEACAGIAGVLEIGPGPGILTRPLSVATERILAVELDSRMLDVLSETAPAATVVQEDAVRADWSMLLRELPTPRAIVSNLPYYITGPLLQKVAECSAEIHRAVLMMQREVAERVRALPGDSERGSLSVHLQGRFRISKLAEVPPGAFLPPPRVSSAVLVFEPRADPLDPRVEPLARLGFAHPRKTLANNLASSGRWRRERVSEALALAGIAAEIRPHQLGEAQWVELARALGLL